MKRLLTTTLLLSFIVCIDTRAQDMPRWWYKRDPRPNEVAPWNTGVSVPVGYILLVRKKSQHCAVKFTEAWKGKSRYDEHARYVSYYPLDPNKGFTQDNLKLTEGQLHYRPVNWGGCHFVIGDSSVRCGAFALVWHYPTFLLFLEPGDRDHHLGIEIAPTSWKDIREVNFLDPRLRWYEFEEDRDATYFPIGQL